MKHIKFKIGEKLDLLDEITFNKCLIEKEYPILNEEEVLAKVISDKIFDKFKDLEA